MPDLDVEYGENNIMTYKILLDDNSFIVADDDYKIKIFWLFFNETIKVKSYLNNNRFNKYYMLDKINGKLIKRHFKVIPFDNLENYKVGSRIKLAKDIQIGDLVLGADGNPRMVEELHTGEDDMYEITIDDKSYVVNGGHILELIDRDTQEHLQIPVNVYMHMSDEFKSHYVMERINL